MQNTSAPSSPLREGLEKFSIHVATTIDVDGIYHALTDFLDASHEELHYEKIEKVMEVFKGFPIYGDHVDIIFLYKKIMLSQENEKKSLAYQQLLRGFIEELKNNLSS